ncbi:MAG TPA: PEP-CTERM/exosortase system-associated acyltransferase [Thermodesulfobacteriota bacterium]|nr:PEP-CTERM/exosortase system-associated acyltransferase [Deltaproteobacteria bacterium]HNR14500.1 PEP-CTERM/exosortase system-associated acyltransferase [Thermodesulfobacteriota bacterium]HNU71129.1 PEP-CTERM/exosortase system-associated acyltransferase [Thermodesulfobacteriota bacterium]HQO77693.1 PEP-CTERM/exosortase system-associated acyltransferase [Thermodesulfobacteriota bacterium]
MFRIGKFRFVEVCSEELRKATYRLRYQVFVEEYGFEAHEDHPSGYETDSYEDHSIHFAALDDEDKVVGTIRLVLPSANGLPIAHAVSSLMTDCMSDQGTGIAEISRLAVDKTCRRRQEDGLFGVESYLLESEGGILPDTEPVPENHGRRRRPVIILGLFRIMYYASKQRDISHWYMIGEKKLYCALKKYGFSFRQLGAPLEYHGIRIPGMAVIREVEDSLCQSRPDVFGLIVRHMKEHHRPQP